MDKPAGSTLARRVRALWRGSVFLAISAAAVIDYLCRYHGAPLRRRARWQQHWGRRFAWLVGLEIEVCGRIPRSGLIVANHLGYVDILALSAIMPCVFVAKSEVARWPVLGVLARIAGTIFVDRSRRTAVAGVNGRIEAATRAGLSVVLFPEGTSSDGGSVLPFKASLLAPACRTDCALTPAALSYRSETGSAAMDICYWGEMTLLPHLLRLFQHEVIHARVVFGPSFRPAATRKELAAALREHVSSLRSAPGCPPDHSAPALAITKI